MTETIPVAASAELRTVLAETPLDERKRVIIRHVQKVLNNTAEDRSFMEMIELVWPKQRRLKTDAGLVDHLITIIKNACDDGRLNGYWHHGPSEPGKSFMKGRMVQPKRFHGYRHAVTQGKAVEPHLTTCPHCGQSF
jgi:hypothetical protein